MRPTTSDRLAAQAIERRARSQANTRLYRDRLARAQTSTAYRCGQAIGVLAAGALVVGLVLAIVAGVVGIARLIAH